MLLLSCVLINKVLKPTVFEGRAISSVCVRSPVLVLATILVALPIPGSVLK